MSGLDKDLQGYNLATHILAPEPHPELEDRVDTLEDIVGGGEGGVNLREFNISIPICGFGSVVPTTFEITIPCSFAYHITGWRIHSTMIGSCTFTVTSEDQGLLFSPSVSGNDDNTGVEDEFIIADDVLVIAISSLSSFTDITLTLECERAVEE